MIESRNPYNNEVLATYEAEDAGRIEQKINQAHEAFLDWRCRSFDERAGLMRKVADLLRERKESLAQLMTVEMGKVRREAIAEVEKCAWVCDYYATYAGQFLTEEVVRTDASRSYVRFAPLGVVLAVMPWNFPFWQVFRFAAPALMAGNAALLKHASNVPQCALAIEKLFVDAGFPEHIFQTLLIGAGAVEAVIRHDKVRAVTLTGSEAAGRKVAAVAGECLKKTVLELGGSDPFIVLPDVDIEAVAAKAVQARMINNGQSCIAAKRFIVHAGIYDSFAEAFVEHMRKLRFGKPEDEATDYAAMARHDLRDELHAQVQASIKAGATCLLGGKPMEHPGACYEPTVLAGVLPGMPAFDEELFGPVAALIKASSTEEALQLANRSAYGLGGSVWTADTLKGEQLAQQLEVGCAFVNGIVKSDPRLPFGGVKHSGYGRELSIFGIREFVNIQTLWIA
ncbi:MAG: succinate-semialdehyde dehydrogenase [Thermonema sp.]|uniref:NAD-dependent succinate-semialdehyde dehydrogenase n=1 Tax=Thermonema sp. TaxID=2231181 RepID=UPI0021DE93A5|nr:NAD-dependent succinate-semialdehyde dehydrogenase [Thermonema sp.]GIV38892.1 MAG: succinate-semialdehyde dehydrogenase [Thermonema sp.]